MSQNVFGTELESCGNDPLTGFYRDGACNTCKEDRGIHTVCAIMTEDFLAFSTMVGNDLVTARPEYGFPGLKIGDRWCLSARRWLEAHVAELAPPVILQSTHERTLDIIPMDILLQYAYKTV